MFFCLVFAMPLCASVHMRVWMGVWYSLFIKNLAHIHLNKILGYSLKSDLHRLPISHKRDTRLI